MDKLGIAAVAIAVVGLALSLWQIMSLRRRLDGALSGEQGNLEEQLTTYFKQIKDSDRRMKELADHYLKLSASAALASQKISVVRFNPFGDTGGDQSFVLAVLDSHNSGYVLTSIHGREGTRVYVKPIDYAKSKYTLSKEEQQAIAQAIKRVPMVQQKILVASHNEVMGAGAETVIGSGVVAKGSLTSESDVVIDGTFTGDIKTGGGVTLGVNALVQGNIKARSVSVSGELTGNITTEEEASIHETGRLTGDIVAGQIAIYAGAIFNGTTKMNAPLAAPKAPSKEE